MSSVTPEHTVLRILTDDDPVLQAVAEDFDLNDSTLPDLVADMLARLKFVGGLGLAAPQVGVSRRLFVIDTIRILGRVGPTAFVNPVITARTGYVVASEGCLSLPGVLREMARAEKITVEALDLTGRPFKVEYGGLMARVMQHEVDHLDGRLITDS